VLVAQVYHIGIAQQRKRQGSALFFFALCKKAGVLFQFQLFYKAKKFNGVTHKAAKRKAVGLMVYLRNVQGMPYYFFQYKNLVKKWFSYAVVSAGVYLAGFKKAVIHTAKLKKSWFAPCLFGFFACVCVQY